MPALRGSLPMHVAEAVAVRILPQLFELTPLPRPPHGVRAEVAAPQKNGRHIFPLVEKIRIHAQLRAHRLARAHRPESERRHPLQRHRLEHEPPALRRRERPLEPRQRRARGQLRRAIVQRVDLARKGHAQPQRPRRLRLIVNAHLHRPRTILLQPHHFRQLDADPRQPPLRQHRIRQRQHTQPADEHPRNRPRPRQRRAHRGKRQPDERHPHDQPRLRDDHSAKSSVTMHAQNASLPRTRQGALR